MVEQLDPQVEIPILKEKQKGTEEKLESHETSCEVRNQRILERLDKGNDRMWMMTLYGVIGFLILGGERAIAWVAKFTGG